MVLPADQYKGYFKDSELTEEEKKKYKIDPKDAALFAADFVPVVSDIKAVYDYPEDMKFAKDLWNNDAETKLGNVGLKTAGAGYGLLSTLGTIPVAGYAFRKGKKALKGGLKLVDKDKQLELPLNKAKTETKFKSEPRPDKKLYHAAQSMSSYNTRFSAPSGLLERVTNPDVAKQMGFKPFTKKEIKSLEDAPLDKFDDSGYLLPGGRSDVLYKLLKSRGKNATGGHTYRNNLEEEVTLQIPSVRKEGLRDEGFSAYESFTGAAGLNTNSSGRHMELNVHGLSLSRDPIMSAHSFTRQMGEPITLKKVPDDSSEYAKKMDLYKYELTDRGLKQIDDMIDDIVYTKMPKSNVNVTPEGYYQANIGQPNLLTQSQIFSGKYKTDAPSDQKIFSDDAEIIGGNLSYGNKPNADTLTSHKNVYNELTGSWADTANLPKSLHTEFETVAFRPEKLDKPKILRDDPKLSEEVALGIVKSNKVFRETKDWTWELEKFVDNYRSIAGEVVDKSDMRYAKSKAGNKEALKLYHQIRQNLKQAKGLGAYTEGGARGTYDKFMTNMFSSLNDTFIGSSEHTLDILAKALPKQKAENIHALSFLMKLQYRLSNHGANSSTIQRAREVTDRIKMGDISDNFSGFVLGNKNLTSGSVVRKKADQRLLDRTPTLKKIVESIKPKKIADTDTMSEFADIELKDGLGMIQEAIGEITQNFNRGGLVSRN